MIFPFFVRILVKSAALGSELGWCGIGIFSEAIKLRLESTASPYSPPSYYIALANSDVICVRMPISEGKSNFFALMILKYLLVQNF